MGLIVLFNMFLFIALAKVSEHKKHKGWVIAGITVIAIELISLIVFLEDVINKIF